MKELTDLVEKAGRFLRTAERAASDGDYDSCASRCYYAMFFMAEAALLTKQLQASSHRGIINMFGKHLVKPGIFDKHLGSVLNNAYDKRLVGDYAVGLAITREEAKHLLSETRDFVERVREYLDQWMDEK
mgnify:CR=1 FL=1